MNVHQPAVITSESHQKETDANAVTEQRAQPAEETHVREHRGSHAGPARVRTHLASSGAPPTSQVDTLEGGRERASEEDGEHETEDTLGLSDVVGGLERLLRHRERLPTDTEAVRHRPEDRGADARRHERGDDDHEREEGHERLAGQRHAAVDELDFEHALPHLPQKCPV